MVTHEQRIAELSAELAALGPAPKRGADRSNPYPPGTEQHHLGNWTQTELEQQLNAIRVVLHDDEFASFLPLPKERNPTTGHIKQNHKRQKNRKQRYPFGSHEHGFSLATREQLEQIKARIEQTLADNDRCSFLADAGQQ